MLLIALLSADELGRLVQESSAEFLRVNLGVLRQNWGAILKGSVEEANVDAAAPAGDAPKAAGGATPNLGQYTIDLTAAARAGALGTAVCRDNGIHQGDDLR